MSVIQGSLQNGVYYSENIFVPNTNIPLFALRKSGVTAWDITKYDPTIRTYRPIRSSYTVGRVKANRYKSFLDARTACMHQHVFM